MSPAGTETALGRPRMNVADDIRESDLDTDIHPDGARDWLAGIRKV
ncbi:MAG: hypothetical protein ACM30F_07185 [Nitrospirota bacterium]